MERRTICNEASYDLGTGLVIEEQGQTNLRCNLEGLGNAHAQALETSPIGVLLTLRSGGNKAS